MHEIELKFQIPPAGREALDAVVRTDGTDGADRAGGAGVVTRLQASYFDTDDRLLGRSAFALRLRREGEGWVQTLKGRGDGMMKRLEHNAPVTVAVAGDAVPVLSLQRHSEAPAGQALLALLEQANRRAEDLRLQFSTDIARTYRQVSVEGAQIELALDVGVIAGGGRELPVHEIEFELVGGSTHGLLAQCALWVDAFGLWLDVRSKAERGDRLARGSIHGEVPALAPIDAAAPFAEQIGQALQPVLALASEAADGLAAPAHQVALSQAMVRLTEVLRRAEVEPWLIDMTVLLTGWVFEPAAWRLPDTQRLWLVLMGFTVAEPD